MTNGSSENAKNGYLAKSTWKDKAGIQPPVIGGQNVPCASGEFAVCGQFARICRGRARRCKCVGFFIERSAGQGFGAAPASLRRNPVCAGGTRGLESERADI